MFVFLGPEISSFWPKNPPPILVNGQFVALGETVNFPHWGRFFDFLFLSYGRFRKKKLGERIKKSSPSPLWGHRLSVTALALSARGLDKSEKVA